MASNGDFTCKEDLSELQLGCHCSAADLRAHIKQLVKADTPLLQPQFTQVSEPDGEQTFRVMQWNILAQALSKGKDNFIHCPKEALDWQLRRLRILEAILDVNPDILSIQEVDHFPFLNEVLGSVGYIGTFCPKPDSPCLHAPESNGPDGCAAFFRADKFEELSRHDFVLYADGEATNQVCATITLKAKSCGREVTVAVTHLKAKYGWDDLRFRQGSYMLDYIQKNLKPSSVLLCGDFNADPDEKIHEACLKSELNLRSAYTLLSESGKDEPRYTTWKIRGGKDGKDQDVCRAIDYIWFSQQHLAVVALQEMPSEEEIGPARVPSFAFPSDHFSLAADFKFI